VGARNRDDGLTNYAPAGGKAGSHLVDKVKEVSLEHTIHISYDHSLYPKRRSIWPSTYFISHTS